MRGDKEMTREQLEAELDRNVPLAKGRNVWIWGAGNTALHSQETLKRTGMAVCGYCDNEKNKQGKAFAGRPVISPDSLLKEKDVCVLVCVGHEDQAAEIVSWLDGHGIEWHLFEEAVLKLHKEEILECYDLLDDDISRNVYASIISLRMDWFRDMPDASCISGNQYFCLPQFNRTTGLKKEVFVDCGAYTGDTVEEYIWKQYGEFQKIIVFEPDAENFRAMSYRIERLKKEWNLKGDSIEMHCCGVGKRSGRDSFIQGGSSKSRKADFGLLESMEETNITDIEIVSLDEFLDEPYSFLKADIEGAEFDMIRGAENGIRTNKPLLAVCIYHHTADLFQIQLTLRQMVPEYKFAVRHHAAGITETVLYAYTS